MDILPITMVDGEVVKTKEYPTDAEFAKWTGLTIEEIKAESEKEGCCTGGCC